MSGKHGRRSHRGFEPVLRAVEAQENKRAADWLAGRLDLLPARWAAHVGAEHRRRGGLASAAANRWALGVTEAGRGRVPLSASDDDLRAAAKAAAAEGVDIAALADTRGGDALRALLGDHCRRWGIEPVAAHIESGPAVRLARREGGRMAARAWCDLSAELRGKVQAGLRRFRAWSERVQ